MRIVQNWSILRDERSLVGGIERPAEGRRDLQVVESSDLRKDCRLSEDHLLVGRMGRPFGVHGYGRVTVFSENPSRFVDDRGETFLIAPPVRSSVELRRLVLEDVQVKGESFLLKWKGIESPEALREFSGWKIFWEGPDEWSPENEDEIRISDLIGMTVRDFETHLNVGTISDFYERPGQDLLAIDAGGREVLCPFVEPLVPVVDRDKGEVFVRWSIVGT